MEIPRTLPDPPDEPVSSQSPEPEPDTFGERIELPSPSETVDATSHPDIEPDYIPVFHEHDEFGEWLMRET